MRPPQRAIPTRYTNDVLLSAAFAKPIKSLERDNCHFERGEKSLWCDNYRGIPQQRTLLMTISRLRARLTYSIY